MNASLTRSLQIASILSVHAVYRVKIFSVHGHPYTEIRKLLFNEIFLVGQFIHTKLIEVFLYGKLNFNSIKTIRTLNG